MRDISFDELREKEVINPNDCKRLGFINNILIDIECGKITSLIVRNCSGFIPGKGDEIKIPWENVSKIGDDIIFVDICYTAPSAPLPQKKKFFS